jgi:phosphonate transport system substrate-binding protein
MLSRRHSLALAASALALPTAARAQDLPPKGKRAWAAQLPQIRLGMLGGENDADRLARYGGYQKLLEEWFEVPVKLVLAADYAGVIQAFAAKQVDASYMSPAAYAAAWVESQGNVEPILTTLEKDGTKSYVSVMYVRADSGITTVEGMKGRAMAWSDPNSASGYLIPRAEFRAAGIDPDKYFGRTGFAGGAEQSVVAVLGKQYDAGVAWSSGQGDATQGYTRGVLTTMVQKKMIDMKDLRIIWRSRPITNGPFVLRKDTPDSFRADMLALHRAIPVHYPQIYHAVDMGSGAGWSPVTHTDYQVFVDILKAEADARRRR